MHLPLARRPLDFWTTFKTNCSGIVIDSTNSLTGMDHRCKWRSKQQLESWSTLLVLQKRRRFKPK